jgi:hypothetical protein
MSISVTGACPSAAALAARIAQAAAGDGMMRCSMLMA